MSDFNVRITEVTVDRDGYRFRVRLNDKLNRWTVTRWPVEENPIPPRMQHLTTEGWIGVIPASNEGKKLRTFARPADLAPLIS